MENSEVILNLDSAEDNATSGEDDFEMINILPGSSQLVKPQANLRKNLDNVKNFIENSKDITQNLKDEIQLYKNIQAIQNDEIIRLQKELSNEKHKHASDVAGKVKLSTKLEEQRKLYQDKIFELAALNDRLEQEQDSNNKVFEEKETLLKQIHQLEEQIAIIPQLLEENQKQKAIINSMSFAVYYSKVSVLWIVNLFRRFFALVARNLLRIGRYFRK